MQSVDQELDLAKNDVTFWKLFNKNRDPKEKEFIFEREVAILIRKFELKYWKFWCIWGWNGKNLIVVLTVSHKKAK